MQFRDLRKQYDILKKDIDKAIMDVTSSGQYIGGAWVDDIEAQLAEYVGTRHCITCANGTDALYMAMMAWDIHEGDAVFVPDFTFFSSGETVSQTGGTPVFVDVDKDTYNISGSSLERAITEVIEEGKLTPRAVIAVDLFGLPADYESIRGIANKYGLLILEDGAQGFGGEIKGKRACSFGDISTTSFFPAKPLGCFGDGGAVFTDDDEIDAKIRSIKVHGKGATKYDNVRIGLNSRLDTIQAAILQVKLEAFREFELDSVNKVADEYNNLLRDDLGDRVVLPTVPEGYLSSWAQYTIQLKDSETRTLVQTVLKEKGIPSMVYYPKPMHKQEAFFNAYECDCRNTLDLCETVISLPMHPYLTKDEINDVVSALMEAHQRAM